MLYFCLYVIVISPAFSAPGKTVGNVTEECNDPEVCTRDWALQHRPLIRLIQTRDHFYI